MAVITSIHKQCPVCGQMFTPDPRVGQRQRYCSQAECQKARQRENESAWRERNPDCVSAQNHKWQQKNPGYLQEWRARHPDAVERNRSFMRKHMRRKRDHAMFDKSKEMLLQLAGRYGDMYVSRGRGWLITRLKRASIWSGPWVRRYAYRRVAVDRVRLPRGRLFDISGIG